MRRLVSTLIGGVLLVGLIAPASSSAAANFGSNLADTYNSTLVNPTPAAAWESSLAASSTAGTLVAPFNGVVVSFTLKTGPATWPPIHLRVIQPLGPNWGGLATSSPDVVPTTTAGLQTFPVRVPIAVGDYVGIESSVQTDFAAVAIKSPGSGDTVNYGQLPANGAGTTASTSSDRVLLLQAREEPDADGDGYGDETQDLCPTNPAVHTSCPAHLKRCKKHKHKRAARSAKKKCRKRKKR